MKQKKTKPAKKEAPIGIKSPSAEEVSEKAERFLAALEKQFKDVPDAEIERGAKRVKDFMDGKTSWIDLINFTPEILFQLAEYGFTQFKTGRYADAERIFKVLTIIDWNNAYYHSVMGSILQREKRYGEALAEYAQAIDLDPRDIASLVNRGEIFMQHGLVADAKADFTRAVELDQAGEDKFANRARMLIDQMEKLSKEKQKGD